MKRDKEISIDAKDVKVKIGGREIGPFVSVSLLCDHKPREVKNERVMMVPKELDGWRELPDDQINALVNCNDLLGWFLETLKPLGERGAGLGWSASLEVITGKPALPAVLRGWRELDDEALNYRCSIVTVSNDGQRFASYMGAKCSGLDRRADLAAEFGTRDPEESVSRNLSTYSNVELDFGEISIEKIKADMVKLRDVLKAEMPVYYPPGYGFDPGGPVDSASRLSPEAQAALAHDGEQWVLASEPAVATLRSPEPPCTHPRDRLVAGKGKTWECMNCDAVIE